MKSILGGLLFLSCATTDAATIIQLAPSSSMGVPDILFEGPMEWDGFAYTSLPATRVLELYEEESKTMEDSVFEYSIRLESARCLCRQ